MSIWLEERGLHVRLLGGQFGLNLTEHLLSRADVGLHDADVGQFLLDLRLKFRQLRIVVGVEG